MAGQIHYIQRLLVLSTVLPALHKRPPAIFLIWENRKSLPRAELNSNLRESSRSAGERLSSLLYRKTIRAQNGRQKIEDFAGSAISGPASTSALRISRAPQGILNGRARLPAKRIWGGLKKVLDSENGWHYLERS